MAHYAILDENNIVTNVIVISNEDVLDENGNECEELGANKCKEIFLNNDLKCVKTSYNANIRNYYAGIGYYYDEESDVFIPPQPYPSWTLNETTKKWESPTPKPTEIIQNGGYSWNEDTLTWDAIYLPIKIITLENFRSQLTVSEKILFDTPSTGTSAQEATLNTFKFELPLTITDIETPELLDLLVSSEVYTQERLDEIIENI